MKKILLFFVCFFYAAGLSAQSMEDIINKNIKLIQVQAELIMMQQKDLDNVSKCLQAKLTYHQEKYTVTVTCEVKNHAINYQYKIVDDVPTKINKEFDFYFQREVAKRPYEMVPWGFKLGGIFYYDMKQEKFNPDIMLGVEFFSFDKWIPFYGLSLNAGIGIRTISVQLAYQLLYTKWFTNTNIMIGYSYSYLDQNFNPTLGIALNF